MTGLYGRLKERQRKKRLSDRKRNRGSEEECKRQKQREPGGDREIEEEDKGSLTEGSTGRVRVREKVPEVTERPERKGRNSSAANQGTIK